VSSSSFYLPKMLSYKSIIHRKIFGGLWQRKSFIEGIPTLFIRMDTTKEHKVCIEEFGRMPMGKFQKTIIFIIKMAIRKITPWKTWNVFLNMIIINIIDIIVKFKTQAASTGQIFPLCTHASTTFWAANQVKHTSPASYSHLKVIS